MKKLKKFFFSLLHSLNLTTELSSEEKLAIVLREQQQANLLDDIKFVRTNGDYRPDYNKEPAFQDYQLKLGEGEVGWRPQITRSRQIEFDSVEAWRLFIHNEVVRIQEKENGVGHQLNLF